MRFASSALVAVTSYAALASALPYWSQQAVERSIQNARRKVAYSVVPVDGGPSSSMAAETKTEETTKTITEPASTIPPTTQTIISTIVVTDSDTETTLTVTATYISSPSITPDPPQDPSPVAPLVEVTTTEYSQATVTNEVLVPEVVPISTSFLTSSTTTSTLISALSSIPSSLASPTSTIFPLQITITSTVSYDDGMYHASSSQVTPTSSITYDDGMYHPPDPPAAFTSSSSQSSSTTSTSYDNGMYHTTWSVWNATSYAPTPTTTSILNPLPTLAAGTEAPSDPTQTPANGNDISESSPSMTILRRNRRPSTKPSPNPSSGLSPPDLPKLPKTKSQAPTPTELPMIDVSEPHVILGER